MAEFAAKGESSEFSVAAPLHDRRERVFDDADGDSATSQFIHDAQAALAAAHDQLLGAPTRQRAVVEVAQLAQRSHRRVDDRAAEPPPCQPHFDLGNRARRPSEKTDRDVTGSGGVACGGGAVARDAAGARRSVRTD